MSETLEEQQAREEAELAEQMSPELDDDQADDDETDDVVDDASASRNGDEGPSSETMIELTNRKFEQLRKHVEKRLGEIMGEDAEQIVPCPRCTYSKMPGFVWPTIPPEEVVELVKQSVGVGTLEEYPEDAAYQRCGTCHGMGSVRTGSQVPAQMVRPCRSCKGSGFSSTLPADQEPPAPPAPFIAEPAFEGGPPTLPDRDPFGTPAGHPDYGKLPQFREVPVSTWADQAPQP